MLPYIAGFSKQDRQNKTEGLLLESWVVVEHNLNQKEIKFQN